MSLSFAPCHCKGGKHNRVPRSLWMHFFPTRRLYQCSECDHRALAVKKDMEAAKWAAKTYIPRLSGDPANKQNI